MPPIFYPMKSEEALNLKIIDQVKHDVLLRDAEIMVAISDQEVIISGTVNKFFKKALICSIARKTTRIKNIVDHIMVVLHGDFNDIEITAEIAEKLEKNLGNSFKNVAISVKDGQVLLEGTLKWNYQKNLTTECISYVEGIVSIQNEIIIHTVSEFSISEKAILDAIYKEDLITSDIGVKLSGKKVTLHGNVSTSFQKKLIENTVSKLPGVGEIENCLQLLKKTST